MLGSSSTRMEFTVGKRLSSTYSSGTVLQVVLMGVSGMLPATFASSSSSQG